MKQAFEKLDEKLSEKGVCVAVKAKLSKDSGVGKGIDFDHIVEKLQDKPKAKGKNITFCNFLFKSNSLSDTTCLKLSIASINYRLSSNRRIAYICQPHHRTSLINIY